VVEFPTPDSQEGNQGRGAGLWPGKPPPCLVPDRLPGRHVLRCREVLSLGQPFSLMRGCRRQQVPRSETHWEVPVPTAWWDPEGQQSKRDFLEEVFAPTTVLAKAAKSSSCRVSAHMQQISVVNFVVSSTPQGSAALPRARDPVLSSHLQSNICSGSSRHCMATFTSARARFVLGAGLHRGCCHGEYQCLWKLQNPTQRIEAPRFLLCRAPTKLGTN